MANVQAKIGSDAGSDHTDSTTLSDFVKSRWNGSIPVFGGNPANGFRDVSRAAYGSASAANMRLLSAVGELSTVVREMTLQNPAYSFRQSADRRGSDSPVAMVANDNDSMAAAANLSEEKIGHLLSAGSVRVDDISAFMQLLKIARDGLRKKEAAQDLQKARRGAKLSFTPLVSRDELEADLVTNRQRIDKLKQICGVVLPPAADVDLLTAITHDSYYNGRESNRVYAYLGDVVCKLYVAEHMLALRKSVESVSDLVNSQQTNDAFRTKAIAIKLHECVRVAVNVDVQSKSVIATAYEAVVAVVYLHAGMDGIEALNVTFRFYEPK